MGLGVVEATGHEENIPFGGCKQPDIARLVRAVAPQSGEHLRLLLCFVIRLGHSSSGRSV